MNHSKKKNYQHDHKESCGPAQAISRRSLLKNGVGTLPLLGISPGQMALSQSTTTYPFFLVIECSGGWDQTLVFDDKLSVSTVSTDGSASSETGAGTLTYVHNASRPAVKNFFDSQGVYSTIVNGILCHSVDHDVALEQTTTTLSVTTEEITNYLTFYSTLVGAGTGFPALSVDLPVTPGTLDRNTYRVTLDDLENRLPQYRSSFSESTKAALRSYLNATYTNFTSGRLIGNSSGLKLNAFASKGLKEDAAPSVFGSLFDATETTSLRKRAKFALNLFANNYAMTAHVLDEDKLSWDDHSNTISAGGARFNRLFEDLSDIVAHAESLGIDQRLVIVVKSEMGRHPRIVSGLKNHWPFTSCLIWNKNMAGGKTVGQTDDYLRGLKLDPSIATENSANAVEVTFDSIFSALFSYSGVNSRLLWNEEILPANFII